MCVCIRHRSGEDINMDTAAIKRTITTPSTLLQHQLSRTTILATSRSSQPSASQSQSPNSLSTALPRISEATTTEIATETVILSTTTGTGTIQRNQNHNIDHYQISPTTTTVSSKRHNDDVIIGGGGGGGGGGGTNDDCGGKVLSLKTLTNNNSNSSSSSRTRTRSRTIISSTSTPIITTTTTTTTTPRTTLTTTRQTRATTTITTATSRTTPAAVTTSIKCLIYKFLAARYSGPKIFRKLVSPVIIILVLTLFRCTDACSSRTTPKPRPPTPTPRPNITFHTYKCPPAYAAWYCLNDATCFTVKIGDSLLYNCECADGYMGPRCEYKDLDGSYLPSRPRVMLETASIASGATLALFLVVVLCIVFYVRWHQQQKKEQLTLDENGGTAPDGKGGGSGGGGGGGGGNSPGSAGFDTVDGMPMTHSKRLRQPEMMRPFGPHHQKIIPMAEALIKR